MSQTPPAHPLPAHARRRAARLGRGRAPGPLLVKAANWLTHLEYDWESPVWRHWIRFFADHFRFVRYDERGCGMTRLERRRPLLRALGRGPRGGGRRRPDRASRSRCSASRRAPPSCIAYAVRHPGARLAPLLYGGYARGWARRGDPERRARVRGDHRARAPRAGARTTPPSARSSRRASSRGRPTSRSTGSTSCAARRPRPRSRPSSCEARADDRRRRTCSPQVRAPDARAPRARRRRGADRRGPPARRRHPGRAVRRARLAATTSCSSTSRPGSASARRCSSSWASTAAPRARTPPSPSLSPREREILALITRGPRQRRDRASASSISEKTVRNHVSNVFDKLGVWTRAQAIVFARDRGFRR